MLGDALSSCRSRAAAAGAGSVGGGPPRIVLPVASELPSPALAAAAGHAATVRCGTDLAGLEGQGCWVQRAVEFGCSPWR